jgi:hypothetical protein
VGLASEDRIDREGDYCQVPCHRSLDFNIDGDGTVTVSGNSRAAVGQYGKLKEEVPSGNL